MRTKTLVTDRDVLIERYESPLSNPVRISTPSARHAKVGPADLWQMKRDFQIRFLMNAGLKPQHRLLDFGCGSLRGGLPLIQYLDIGNYTGIEIRQEALNEAKHELEESGLSIKKPRLECTNDLSALRLGTQFDAIWSFSVLIHLADAVLKEVLSFVSRHLDDRGVFYANVNIGSQPDGAWQGFPLVHRSFEFYRDFFEECKMTVCNLGCLPEFGHVHPRLSQEAQQSQRMLCAFLK